MTRAAESPVSATGSHMRVGVVGMSERHACGVRDHARLLSAAMNEVGYRSETLWLERRESTLLRGRREAREWMGRLATEIDNVQPDAVVLHYSAFAYSYRGIPMFARPIAATLARAGCPVIAVLHEFAYPWAGAGWRGIIWAATQRIALAELLRASTAVVVTTEARGRWLESRRWLPRRPITVAPVFSNLPPPALRRRGSSSDTMLGIFGYSLERVAAAPILDALARLRQMGSEATLMLLGAPGRFSAMGEAWLEAARARGLEDAIDFSGVLPAQRLSDELARCAVLLFADSEGPASRNGTLAASLASGVPLVAMDGPVCWQKLRESGAALVVEPSAAALFEALRALLANEGLRSDLGARGQAFAAGEMGIDRTLEAVADLLGPGSG